MFTYYSQIPDIIYNIEYYILSKNAISDFGTLFSEFSITSEGSIDAYQSVKILSPISLQSYGFTDYKEPYDTVLYLVSKNNGSTILTPGVVDNPSYYIDSIEIIDSNQSSKPVSNFDLVNNINDGDTIQYNIRHMVKISFAFSLEDRTIAEGEFYVNGNLYYDRDIKFFSNRVYGTNQEADAFNVALTDAYIYIPANMYKFSDILSSDIFSASDYDGSNGISYSGLEVVYNDNMDRKYFANYIDGDPIEDDELIECDMTIICHFIYGALELPLEPDLPET